MEEHNYTVYMHKNKINGKVYIGITKQKPEKRWNNGKGYNDQYFKRAVNKYGFDNFEHLILYENLTQKEAEQKEIELIKYYKSNLRKFGYNIANGGNTIGKHSKETKLKISNSHKGKKRSEELTKKLIEINRGNKYRFGSHQTEEAKKKISEANKGNKYNVGRIVSEETKNKISIATKGRHRSPNTEFKKGCTNIKWRKKVLCIDTNTLYESITFASEDTNISISCISTCCSGKTKTAGHYHWRYYEK
jgi:group I intron endonuclease